MPVLMSSYTLKRETASVALSEGNKINLPAQLLPCCENVCHVFWFCTDSRIKIRRASLCWLILVFQTEPQ